MRPAVLTLLAPTVAVCKFGCASCCAAPVTVFWLAGIVSIIFGFLGGLTGTNWAAVTLGLGLSGIASLWTAFAIRASGKAQCDRPDSAVCQTMNSGTDDSEALNEVRRAH